MHLTVEPITILVIVITAFVMFAVLRYGIIPSVMFAEHLGGHRGVNRMSKASQGPQLDKFASRGKRPTYVVKDLKRNPASKSEEVVRNELQLITGCMFPCVYPSWLMGMELDGYCDELKTGFEFQGPQHTKFDKQFDTSYDVYLKRTEDDALKRKLCPENGVSLMIVDYILPRHLLNTYLRSRLYDASKFNPLLAKFAYLPPGYIPLIKHVPFRR